MTTSEKGHNLAKRSEDEKGFLLGRCTTLKAYRCPSGKWTCGWGSTRGVTADTEWTAEEADARLVVDFFDAENVLANWVTVPLTQNQYDALADFVFNAGPGKKGVKDGFVWLKDGQHSTMLRKLLRRDYAGAAAEFPRWVYGTSPLTGKPVRLPGLVKRRAAERELFESAAPILPEAA